MIIGSERADGVLICTGKKSGARKGGFSEGKTTEKRKKYRTPEESQEKIICQNMIYVH